MIENYKRKAFAILFGQSISLLSSSIMQMAIVWHITLATGSALNLTLATLAGFMPQAILGSFTGPIIDRYPKKQILIMADLGIGIISLGLAILAFTDNMPIWAILIVLVLRSLCNAFHEPATQTLTPLIVPKEYLMQYAGYAQTFLYMSLILSPGLAIALYDILHISFIILLDTVGALLATIILLIVKLPKENFSHQDSKKTYIIKETKEGLRLLKKQEGIIALVILGILYCSIYAPIGTLYPHISLIYFKITTAQAGYVEIILAIGSLLGAFTLGRFAHKIPKIQGMAGSILLYGLSIFIIGLLASDNYYVFMILSFITGFAIPFYHGINRAICQLTIPQEFLGRAFAVINSSRNFGMPLGLIAGGIFADFSGVNILFIIAGIMAIILGMIVLKLPSLQRFRNL